MCMLIREIPSEEDRNFGHSMQCWELMFNMDVKSYILMADVNILCVREVVKV